MPKLYVTQMTTDEFTDETGLYFHEENPDFEDAKRKWNQMQGFTVEYMNVCKTVEFNHPEFEIESGTFMCT